MNEGSLRIATTPQWVRAVREAGFDPVLLPQSLDEDHERGIPARVRDGEICRPFLEKNEVDLVLDFNTAALTLIPDPIAADRLALTTARLGIPYVSCYLDPVTSTMGRVAWANHWQMLEHGGWVKWIYERAHGEELMKLGVPNVLIMPMAAGNDDFDTSPLPEPDGRPVVAFMGHPASSWFAGKHGITSDRLFRGLTAAAVRADMPDLPFHKIYYDLYGFAEPPGPDDDPAVRASKSSAYFNDKFVYNAYLAVKQRERFAHFLKHKLGDDFELIGDDWGAHYGLDHTPRIWDMKVLHDRMRRVPICLNLMKGNLETGLNIRHFEITAYGGFMLAYYTAELDRCFEIGKECDIFRDEQELLEKISYYLQHPEERREVAAAGQRRTLSEHLFSHRVQTLVALLRKSGVLPGAKVAHAAHEARRAFVEPANATTRSKLAT